MGQTIEKSAPLKQVKSLPDAMSQFMQDIFAAKFSGVKIPTVETELSVIQYYNPGAMFQGFQNVGYFVYDGVRVVEKK